MMLNNNHEYADYLNNVNTEKPKQWIVCAANLYDCGSIALGARHFDRLMVEVIENDERFLRQLPQEVRPNPPQQGFIDQFGTFLTRQEAWKIAEANGQIRRRVGGDTIDGGTLFSENLY